MMMCPSQARPEEFIEWLDDLNGHVDWNTDGYEGYHGWFEINHTTAFFFYFCAVNKLVSLVSTIKSKSKT